MRELSLHILDIAENSISAEADTIRILVEENFREDFLKIVIEDNGKGMDPETLERIADPFITSRTTRKVGLGIPFFKAASEACDGIFTMESQPGSGTTVEAVFKHSHIDRMPLGDITGTLLTLIIGTPDVHWIFKYRVDTICFVFDDEPIKQTLEGLPLSEPAVMRFIREMLEEGVRDVRQQAQTGRNTVDHQK